MDRVKQKLDVQSSHMRELEEELALSEKLRLEAEKAAEKAGPHRQVMSHQDSDRTPHHYEDRTRAAESGRQPSDHDVGVGGEYGSSGTHATSTGPARHSAALYPQSAKGRGGRGGGRH